MTRFTLAASSAVFAIALGASAVGAQDVQPDRRASARTPGTSGRIGGTSLETTATSGKTAATSGVTRATSAKIAVTSAAIGVTSRRTVASCGRT